MYFKLIIGCVTKCQHKSVSSVAVIVKCCQRSRLFDGMNSCCIGLANILVYHILILLNTQILQNVQTVINFSLSNTQKHTNRVYFIWSDMTSLLCLY